MDPINYLAAVPQEDFLRDIQGGLQLGQAFQQHRMQNEQRQMALDAAKQYQADLQATMASPTPQNFASLALKYPQQREAVKQAWDGMSAADQKSEGDTMAQAYSALLAGNTDAAKSVVKSQIDARKNSGLDTTHYDNALSLLDADPKQAQAALGFTLSHISDPKTFAQTFGTLQELPGKVAEGEATVAGKQADNELKNLGIVGQAAGALAKPGVKPDQAITMFKSLEARGIIPKGGAQGYIDGMPSDPKALPDYLKQVQASGMKPDEQMKFTTPDANTVVNSATTRRGQDITASTAAARLAFDRDQAKDEPVAPVGTPGLQGQQYLSTLDKPTADQVKALAEGRLGFPVGKALQSPYWQKMITAVAQYDPTFDAINYNARAKTRNDFVAGKSAENIKAINTAVAHMGQLNDQMTALDNSDVPAWNATKNWLAEHGASSDRQGKLAAVNATAEGVAGEMAKVFRSTGMSEHEINAWREKFTGSTTPSAQKGTMQSAMHMLRGRIEAIEDQYRTGMGTTATPLRILTPEAQGIFDKLLGEKRGSSATPAAGADHPADINALLKKYGGR